MPVTLGPSNDVQLRSSMFFVCALEMKYNCMVSMQILYLTFSLMAIINEQLELGM